jgi:hypothetical protein
MYQQDNRDQSAIMASIMASRGKGDHLTKDSVLETDSISTRIKHYKFENCFLLKKNQKHEAYLKVEQKSSVEQVREFHEKNYQNTDKPRKLHPHLINEVDYAVLHHKKLCFDEWVIVKYYEMTPTTLEGLLRKRNKSSGQNSLKTFELRLMLRELADALSSLHNMGKYHGNLNPFEIGLTVDGHCKLWADSLILTQHEYKTLQKNLLFNKNQGLYQSPKVFNALKKNSFKFKVDPAKEDSFSIGLIMLEAGTGISARSVYNGNTFDEGQLAYMIDEFERRHGSDLQLLKNIKGICEVDDSVRTEIDALEWGVFVGSSNKSNAIERNVTSSNFFNTHTDSGPYVFNNSSNSQHTGTQYRSFKSFNNSSRNKTQEVPVNATYQNNYNDDKVMPSLNQQKTPVLRMKRSKTNNHLPTYYQETHNFERRNQMGNVKHQNNRAREFHSKSLPKYKHKTNTTSLFRLPGVPKYTYNLGNKPQTTRFQEDKNDNFRQFSQPRKIREVSNKRVIKQYTEYAPSSPSKFTRVVSYPKQDESKIIKKVLHQNPSQTSPVYKTHKSPEQIKNPKPYNTVTYQNFNHNDLLKNPNYKHNYTGYQQQNKSPFEQTPNQEDLPIYKHPSLQSPIESQPPIEDSQGNQYKIDANEFFANKMMQGSPDNPSNFNSKFNLLSNNFDAKIASDNEMESNTPSYLFDQRNFGSNPKDFDEKFQIDPDELFSQRMFNSNDVRAKEGDEEGRNSLYVPDNYLTDNSGSQETHLNEKSKFFKFDQS